MFTEDYFEFFIGLTLNNSKAWFDDNRTVYEKVVRPQFVSFSEQLQAKLALINPKFAQCDIRKSIFRVNRDIRFSKDKTPYKTNMSVIFSPYGSKNMKAGGLYVEIGPENCAFYSGHYLPEKDELTFIRTQIAANPQLFEEIINEKSFKKFFDHIRGEEAKRIPAPFMVMSKDVPHLLKKQFYIMHAFEPERALGSDFLDFAIDAYKAALPYNTFILGENHGSFGT